MPLDQQRYRALVESAAVNFDFSRGTIQDLSPAGRAMSFVGAPTWARVNGRPCLNQNAINQGATSGVVGPVVDVTGSFSVEVLLQAGVETPVPSVNVPLYQATAGVGGFAFQLRTGAGWWTAYMDLFGLGGGVQRRLTMPVDSWPWDTKPRHGIIVSRNATSDGLAWLNGIPRAVVVTLIGPLANIVNQTVLVGADRGMCIYSLVRAYPFALTNEDAACLAEAAREMVGGF